jgi:transposase-like protein
VYVFGWNRERGPVKIGKAVDLVKRESTLRMSLPFPAQIFWATRCGSECARLEKAVHKSLSRHRLCGEWRDINVAKAEKIIADIASRLGVKHEPDGHLLLRDVQARRARNHERRFRTDRIKGMMRDAEKRVRRIAERHPSRLYDPLFREEAVATALRTGNISHTALALRLRRETLQRWVGKARKGHAP